MASQEWLNKPDEKVLKALCNLENNPDFKVVQNWFLESSHKADVSCRTAENVRLFRAQGASSVLLDFCDHAANSRSKAGKLAMEKAGIRAIP